MFSANNFYQWSLETYLKSKNYCMITYHPFGTRGYKNLQIWDMNTHPDQFQIKDTCHATVLMNDQEPVYINEMIDWKTQQHELKQKAPFLQLNTVYAKHIGIEQEYHTDVRSRFTDQDFEQYYNRLQVMHDPVAHYNDTLTDIEWIARLMFTGTKRPVIVHSELRSPDIKSLSTEFVPVYVFWHGLVARDWYRHWRHNKSCMPNINRADANKRFLLYARDFTGSRSYREHFVKQLIVEHLAPYFQYQNYPDEACLRQHFPLQDRPTHYTSKDFVAEVIDQQTVIPDNRINVPVTDQSSAFINMDDYISTAIQIVAETIFEDQRIHLTEKTFQPMVAGQPFITLSSPGTLEILKYYGFQTFEHVWDESYDKITDPYQRMQAVMDVIHHLKKHDDFESVYEKCLPVCEHNRNHFFSTRFESQMLSEYDHNWRSAYDQQNQIAKQDPGGSLFWFTNENKTMLNCEVTDFEKKFLQFYLKNVSEEQYQGILKQYPWSARL